MLAGRRLDSLMAGDLVVLELCIPLLDHAFRANSIVRHLDGRRRVPLSGLQFLSLKDAQRALIKRYRQFLPLKNVFGLELGQGTSHRKPAPAHLLRCPTRKMKAEG